MNFTKHSNLEGTHAILSPSKSGWIRYTGKDVFLKKLKSYYASEIGTLLHEFAAKRIELGMKLRKGDLDSVLFFLRSKGIPKSVIDMESILPTLTMYINDGIGFKMTPEVVLWYSDSCYGTTDTISFRNKILRIHDYKSGAIPAKMDQLLGYAALFCLEYHVSPEKISSELRIYQSGEILFHKPESEEILSFMKSIQEANTIIEELKGEL